jgi:hypothetical protein
VPSERIGGLSPVGNLVELVVSTSMVSGVSSRSRRGVSLLPETSESSGRLAVIRGSLGSKHSVLASLRTSVGCLRSKDRTVVVSDRCEFTRPVKKLSGGCVRSEERVTIILDGWKFSRDTEGLSVAIWRSSNCRRGSSRAGRRGGVGGYAQSSSVDEISSISSVDVEGVGSVTWPCSL